MSNIYHFFPDLPNPDVSIIFTIQQGVALQNETLVESILTNHFVGYHRDNALSTTYTINGIVPAPSYNPIARFRLDFPDFFDTPLNEDGLRLALLTPYDLVQVVERNAPYLVTMQAFDKYILNNTGSPHTLEFQYKHPYFSIVPFLPDHFGVPTVEITHRIDETGTGQQKLSQFINFHLMRIGYLALQWLHTCGHTKPPEN